MLNSDKSHLVECWWSLWNEMFATHDFLLAIYLYYISTIPHQPDQFLRSQSRLKILMQFDAILEKLTHKISACNSDFLIFIEYSKNLIFRKETISWAAKRESKHKLSNSISRDRRRCFLLNRAPSVPYPKHISVQSRTILFFLYVLQY